MDGAAVATGIGVIGRAGEGAASTYGAGVRSTTRATVVLTGRQAAGTKSAAPAPVRIQTNFRIEPGGSILHAALTAFPLPSRAR